MGEIGYEDAGISGLKTRIEQEIDPRQRGTRKKFLSISPAVADLILAKTELPQILQLQAGQEEYVSTRRLDGDQFDQIMDIIEPSDQIPHGAIRIAVPAHLIGEGNLGVLAIPQEFDLRSRDKRHELERAVGTDGIFGVTLRHLMKSRPDLFNKEDWKPKGRSIYFVSRKGGNFYGAKAFPFFKDGTGENIDYFRKLNTDESGRVKMINWGEEGYGSEAEVKAEGGLIREHGKFYVLQEGTVDKNRKHSPDRRIELAAKSS